MKKNKRNTALTVLAILSVLMTGCIKANEKNSNVIAETPVIEQEVQQQESQQEVQQSEQAEQSSLVGGSVTLDDIPEYYGEQYADVNDGYTFFTEEDMNLSTGLYLTELDSLGRTGVSNAMLGPETIATEERGSIGMIKPSGWHTQRYDDLIADKYLYNRCHQVMYACIGPDSNVPENLFTGTRACNLGMLDAVETDTLNYIRDTGNHVRYRATPMFEGDELVCRAILVEAQSVEDLDWHKCVVVWNVQPGITIDYATGESWEETGTTADTNNVQDTNLEESTYVLNTRSKKFHREDCSGVSTMSDANKKVVTATREELISEGYEPCGICKP